MRNPIIVTVLALSTLALASACASSAAPGPDPSPDAGPSPQKYIIDGGTSEDASPSSSDAGPTTKCGGFPFAADACGTCSETSCCNEAAACAGDKDCAALTACAHVCTTQSCVDACFAAHPEGSNIYTAVSTCADTSCAVACDQNSPGSKGIGDSCVADIDCHGSAQCAIGTGQTVGFCTAGCNYASDCYGYPSTYNQSGYDNACVQIKAGENLCLPGCSTNADCTQYGSGLTCQSLTNGFYVCL